MATEEQPEDLIRYDVLAQQALRGVIRKVLEEVSATGLPGEHHFFITFRTDHPGVRLSARMRERYPEEKPIVIQPSFWALKVSENHFDHCEQGHGVQATSGVLFFDHCSQYRVLETLTATD